MADFVFNIAKGRVAEYANRVNTDDPTNSAFIVVVLETTALEEQAPKLLLTEPRQALLHPMPAQ